MLSQNVPIVAVLVGLFALTAFQTFAAEPGTRPVKGNYARPFEPTTRAAFIPLPPGAVEPRGWLRRLVRHRA